VDIREGDTVKIGEQDVLRRGQKAVVRKVLPRTLVNPLQEYLVEFENLQAAKERFRFCIYREGELI